MKDESPLRRNFNSFWRVCKYGFKNLFRNAWLSIAAIAVMLVALVIILFTLVLNVTANNAISELSKNLKASVYLKDDVPDDELKTLEDALKDNDFVSGVEYVSKQEARERFTTSFQDDKSLIEGLTLVGGDTLPASYEVSVTDLDRMQDVEAITRQDRFTDIIDSVTLGRTDARKTIDRAAAAQRSITSGSIIAAAIFTVISVLIIFNTIRIAIFTRSEEIRSMKLIGATPSFIRGPFLVETSLYGVISGIVAASAVYSVVLSLGSKIANQAEFAQTYDFFTKPDTVAEVYLGTVLLGILVGIFSSVLAMEKHLKLKRW
jgi:cell division transport system permease protein